MPDSVVSAAAAAAAPGFNAEGERNREREMCIECVRGAVESELNNNQARVI